MKRRWYGTPWVGLLFVAAGHAFAADWFVATNGNDAAAGTNWGAAKLTIQAAVDAAASGSTVWVSNGVYATGERAVGGITNRIAVTNAISLRSVNGPECTIIDGSINVRGVYLVTNTVLDGFTVTRGTAQIGGGVYCNGDALVTNCILVQNVGIPYGGGVAFGKVWNCVISCNTSTPINTRGNHGGGTYGSDVRNSLISSNIALSWEGAGGGTFGGSASNCQITANFAWYGGGTANGFVVNCAIVSNAALQGGGSFLGTNRNCLIRNNQAAINDRASQGGGANASLLENCTVCDNSVGGDSQASGAGAYNCTVRNSILYSNRGGYNCVGGTADYSCVESVLPPGIGNITNNPCFVDRFHLLENSACIDAGTNLAWAVTAIDLDGGPRMWNGRVDMGCYEQSRNSSLLPPSITIPVAVSAGETGCYRTTNGAIAVEGLKIAGTLTALSDGKGLFMASGIQQEYSGAIWSNSLPFTEFQSTFSYRSATNDEANPVGTDSTVLVITRAGTDTPGILITSSPPVLFYSVTNVVLSGTNNPHVVGTMWITNRTTGECTSFPAPAYPDREWLAPACALDAGTNSFAVSGTNMFGVWASNSQFAVRGGWGPPALTIAPQTPAYVFYGSKSISLAGFNNEHVAMVCISNSQNAATAWCETPNGSNWVASPIPLDVGTNDLFAFGFNLAGQAATSQVQIVRIESNPIICVSAASTNPVPPYLSWETAATNITSALVIVPDGLMIRVAPGMYQEDLAISNGIWLASSGGPYLTTILGNGGRCITITHSNAVVSGFTITGGRSEGGGGVNMPAGSLIENCIVSNNGVYINTVLGGWSNGGGIRGGRARNCLITGNFVDITGWAKGGVAFSQGGGAANCLLENCTVVGNWTYAYGYTAGCEGGGGFACTFINTIVWSNPAYLGHLPGEYSDGDTFDHSFTNNPEFADGACRLSSYVSPCINAGSNQDWMAEATDLDGALRILGGTVDIGCYETSRDPVLPPPVVNAPVVVSSGSSGLCRSTNDAIWVQGTKPVDCLAVLSVSPSNCYSTNGMYQTAGGAIWSNRIPRNWEPPTEIKTWHFRSASTDEGTISSGETLLNGTAAGFGGLPEIQMDPPNSTDHWAHATQYALSGSRNAHTCEHMWVSNQVNGVTAFFDAAVYPASNWVASSMPLAMGSNVLKVFGTNMLGDVAMAEYEIFRSSFGAPHSASNGAVRIDWVMPTDPAGIYQWQRSVDLPGGIWSNIGASVSATQAMETLIETDTAIPAFFRMIRTGD